MPDEARVAYLASLDEVAYSDALQEEAIDFITHYPDKFVTYTLKRIVYFWTIGFREKTNWFSRGTVMLIASAVLWVLKLLTVLGIVLSWRRWRRTSFLLLLFISFPAPYYVTHVSTYRFRFPIEGLMLVFVAYSISCLLRLRNSATGRVVNEFTR